MNYFASELTQMFGSTKIYQTPVIVGNNLLAKLDNDLRVKIQFGYSKKESMYDTIQVVIIHRLSGVVDTMTVKVSDIIGKYKESGSLYAQDYYIQNSPNFPDDVRWYQPITLEQKAAVADAILSYIAQYNTVGTSRRLPHCDADDYGSAPSFRK